MTNIFRRKLFSPAAVSQSTHILITPGVPGTQHYYLGDGISEAPVANIFFTYITTSLFLMPATSQLQIISTLPPLFKLQINTEDGLE